jgi:signal transduction histidine kinase
MKLANSLRYRLVAGIMGLVMVVCLVFAVGLDFAFNGAEQRLFDDHIKKDVDSFMDQYLLAPEIISLPHRNFRVYIYTRNSKSTLPDFLRNLSSDDDEVTVDNRNYHIITRELADKSFYFLFDDSSFERFENSMGVSILAIALTLCLSAALLGLAITKLIIGPVTDLATRVGRLGQPDSEVDPGTLKTFDEMDVLENAFNSYHARIAEFLKREQEFSADASHELRTPLMAIRSAAENLRHERSSEPRIQELATRIIRSCDQMSAVTEALLLLARERSIPAEKLEVLNVAGYLSEQLDLLAPMLKLRHIKVEVNEQTALNLRVYKVALHIVIGNILKNAVQHSRSDVIHIVLAENSLEVEDFGRGIPESDQDILFKRSSQRGSGDGENTGIGLALAKRFCDEFGWKLDLVSSQGHGTRVRVEFGRSAVVAEALAG